MCLTEARVHGDEFCVDLWYPRVGDNPNKINVGLMDVRASDGLQIEYDFDRDGWIIRQDANDGEGPEDWQEVVFLQSWALTFEERWGKTNE